MDMDHNRYLFDFDDLDKMKQKLPNSGIVESCRFGQQNLPNSGEIFKFEFEFDDGFNHHYCAPVSCNADKSIVLKRSTCAFHSRIFYKIRYNKKAFVQLVGGHNTCKVQRCHLDAIDRVCGMCRFHSCQLYR